MKDQYVILTGSKNNAGDYLIKYRAKQLFAELRPDRKIIDYDAWLPFTPQQLEEVNQSRALILMGGPSLRTDMREVYPMVPALGEIKPPVVTMGIGWKSEHGTWASVQHYTFKFAAQELLKKIDDSGYSSGVRDYHSLSSVLKNGFNHYIMTGCPALYSTEYIGKPFHAPEEIRNISYSLGVSFVENPEMEASMKKNILSLQEMFKGKNFKVVFHHSMQEEHYKNRNDHFYQKHLEMKNWIEQRGIPTADVSGSAENLIAHYRACDLHIGYRVHAHIFMCSENRPSVLLCEDGRGLALVNVISGLIFPGYTLEDEKLRLAKPRNMGTKFMNRLYQSLVSSGQKQVVMKSVKNLDALLVDSLDYEIRNGFPRMAATRAAINAHFDQMKKFLAQLP